MGFLIIFALIWFFGGLLCGGIGEAVAVSDRKNMGFCLGFFLGPLGVLVAALLQSDRPALIQQVIQQAPRRRKRKPLKAESIERPIDPPPPPVLPGKRIMIPFPIPKPPPVQEIARLPKSHGTRKAWAWGLATAAVVLLCGIVGFYFWGPTRKPTETIAERPPAAQALNESTKERPPLPATPAVLHESRITPAESEEALEAVDPKEPIDHDRDPSDAQPVVPAWRVWIDAQGHSVEAKWRGMVNGQVHLLTKDGRSLKIPRDKFSAEDQRWIREKESQSKESALLKR